MMDSVQMLKDHGDPIERNGANLHGICLYFPRYAEFWAKYVFPNRDQADGSKLRPGFPPEIEAVFNHHYLVFYHLTFAKAQIDVLDKPEFRHLVDVADPLYHLGSVRDLCDRMIISVINVEVGPSRVISDEVFEPLKSGKNLNNLNDVHLNAVYRTFQTFHKLELHTEFRNLYKVPSEKCPGGLSLGLYRNLFTHGMPPPRPFEDERPYLPKVEKLERYKNGEYSSGRQKAIREDFEPADELLGRFANELATKLNDLWVVVLEKMGNIASSSQYNHYFERLLTKPVDPNSSEVLDDHTLFGHNYPSGNVDGTLNSNALSAGTAHVTNWEE